MQKAPSYDKRTLIREQNRIVYRKFLRSKQAVTGIFVLLLIVLTALFAQHLAPTSPFTSVMDERLLAPSSLHPFGTDGLGRDLLSRVVYGARISLQVGGSVGLIAGLLGLVLGLYSGYFPIIDNLVMRICDGMNAIPSLLLAITLMTVMGPNIRNVIISLAVVSTPGIALMSRSAVLLAREQTYVEALRAQGASSTRILWLHILPNIMSGVMVQITFVIAGAITSEAALSFLGAGVPPSVPSWGSILSEGKNFIFNSWWMIAFPGLATAMTVLGLNLLGDGLRDILDPKTN